MIQSSPQLPGVEMNAHLPKALSKGDLVGICAPAGANHDTKEVDDFILLLQNLGFRVKVSGNLQTKFGYLSDSFQTKNPQFV